MKRLEFYKMKSIDIGSKITNIFPGVRGLSFFFCCDTNNIKIEKKKITPSIVKYVFILL
jgi:hypothetical protein